MRAIGGYPSAALADDAARLLRSHGIHARVASRLGDSGIMGPTGHGVYEVMLLDDSQIESAERLLTEHRERPSFDDAELQEQARPDLSRLNPCYWPRCPGCGAVLDAAKGASHCACGREVDIEQLIVEEHGPEALAECYPDEPEEIPESLIESVNLACPECRYPLESLPSDGVCPECGTGYSKAELIQRRAGRM